jgi:hypothetical protein
MSKKSKYYTHPTYGMVFGNKELTPSGTIVWPSLVKPREFKQVGAAQDKPSPPRYEVTILFKKSDTKAKLFLENLDVTTQEMLAQYNENKSAKIAAAEFVKDGDNEKKFDPEKYPFFAGNWVLVARNAEKPACWGTERDENGIVLPCEPVKFAGGQVCKLIITPIITAHGISYKLNDIQLVKDDGQRFGGGVVEGASLLSQASDEDLLDSKDDEDTEDSLASVDVL